MSTLWKIPLKSERDDFEERPAKVEEARGFCFSEGWVGIGWEIYELSDREEDSLKYFQALTATLKSNRYINIGAAKSAHTAIANRMKEGDFVWCRAKSDIYWLGKISGSWIYRNTGNFKKYDLYQVRKCSWKRVGPGDAVPGPVKNAYAGRGKAIQCINKEHAAALNGTLLIWRNLNDEKATTEGHAEKRVFSLAAIGHDDLEDIVALYLQTELNWCIIPSTAKRSTPTTEFVLRNVNGQRAYVQVKVDSVSGNVEIPEGVDNFFLFDPNTGEQATLDKRVIRLQPKSIEKFVRDYEALMPSFVKLMLEHDRNTNGIPA